MAGVNSGEIRVAGTGHVYCAPLGSTLPTDATTALDVAFIDLGYAADGFKMTQNLKTTDITAWQTLEPVRVINQSLTREFEFTLLQSNKNTIPLAWGGATIVAGLAGAYSLTLPEASATIAYTYVVDWTDGVTTERIVIPNGIFGTLPTITSGRLDAIKYDLMIRALIPASGGQSVLPYGVDSAVSGV